MSTLVEEIILKGKECIGSIPTELLESGQDENLGLFLKSKMPNRSDDEVANDMRHIFCSARTAEYVTDELISILRILPKCPRLLNFIKFSRARGRAWSMREQYTVCFYDNCKLESLWHEVFHFVAYEYEWMMKACVEYLLDGSTVHKLKTLMPEHNDKHNVYVKEYKPFISPYVGKVYEANNIIFDVELISVFGEHLRTAIKTAELFKANDEHFYFAFGVMMSM